MNWGICISRETGFTPADSRWSLAIGPLQLCNKSAGASPNILHNLVASQSIYFCNPKVKKSISCAGGTGVQQQPRGHTTPQKSIQDLNSPWQDNQFNNQQIMARWAWGQQRGSTERHISSLTVCWIEALTATLPHEENIFLFFLSYNS